MLRFSNKRRMWGLAPTRDWVWCDASSKLLLRQILFLFQVDSGPSFPSKRPKPDKSVAEKRKCISTTERSLMDLLLQVGNSALSANHNHNHNLDDRRKQKHMPVLTAATTIAKPPAVDPILQQFELAQTLNPDHLTADVPSLEDLMWKVFGWGKP